MGSPPLPKPCTSENKHGAGSSCLEGLCIASTSVEIIIVGGCGPEPKYRTAGPAVNNCRALEITPCVSRGSLEEKNHQNEYVCLSHCLLT